MSGAVEDLEQQTSSARQDDGLFGPDSVTWRLFADPASSLGAVCGILLQTLNPDMMTLFSKVSANYGDAAGRAARTVKYLDTTVFGDTAHALAAGEAVRRMHRHAKWTDERTGRVLVADEPDWLVWTHNTLVWGICASSRDVRAEPHGGRTRPLRRRAAQGGRNSSCIDPSRWPRHMPNSTTTSTVKWTGWVHAAGGRATVALRKRR